MVTFEIVPNCIDTMLFSTKGKNCKVLKSCGYNVTEDEAEVTMEFYDGIAIATDGSGLQVSYPKIAALTEKQKEDIAAYCGRNECTQYEVALKYGKLSVGDKKKRVFSEEQFCWLAETMIRLSADLFDKVAEDPETWDDNEAVEFILKNALRFEKELQWQGKDDERYYFEELDKFKEKLLAEKGIGGK